MKGKDMLKRFLFDTKIGELLLGTLERRVGLAVVDADWLARQAEGWHPRACSVQMGRTDPEKMDGARSR